MKNSNLSGWINVINNILITLNDICNQHAKASVGMQQILVRTYVSPSWWMSNNDIPPNTMDVITYPLLQLQSLDRRVSIIFQGKAELSTTKYPWGCILLCYNASVKGSKSASECKHLAIIAQRFNNHNSYETGLESLWFFAIYFVVLRGEKYLTNLSICYVLSRRGDFLRLENWRSLGLCCHIQRGKCHSYKINCRDWWSPEAVEIVFVV